MKERCGGDFKMQKESEDRVLLRRVFQAYRAVAPWNDIYIPGGSLLAVSIWLSVATSGLLVGSALGPAQEPVFYIHLDWCVLLLSAFAAAMLWTLNARFERFASLLYWGLTILYNPFCHFWGIPHRLWYWIDLLSALPVLFAGISVLHVGRELAMERASLVGEIE